jgi:hypothetical protein
MKKHTHKPQETIADFRHRIALMIREQETGKKYSIVGACRRPEWCCKTNSSSTARR